jgi:hypothetical protein
VSVKVIGDKDTKRALAQISEIGSKELWDEMGAKGVQIVQKRTRSGLDVSGLPFAPYSKAYKKTPKNPVNLRLSGDMLNAVTHEGHKDHARIFVEESGRSDGESNLALAVVHDEGSGKAPKRHWFGITLEAEIKQLMKVLDNFVTKMVRNFNR